MLNRYSLIVSGRSYKEKPLFTTVIAEIRIERNVIRRVVEGGLRGLRGLSPLLKILDILGGLSPLQRIYLFSTYRMTRHDYKRSTLSHSIFFTVCHVLPYFLPIQTLLNMLKQLKTSTEYLT